MGAAHLKEAPMDRRDFLQTGVAGLALSGSASAGEQGPVTSRPAPPAGQGTKGQRVGLIGCGCDGKNDLFRLIQVAPVEVVSLCDVDRNMLSEAAEMVAGRQRSKRKPRLYGDYRAMLKEKDLDIVLIGTPD